MNSPTTDDPVLEYSPTSDKGTKRPASDDISPNTKRPAEDKEVNTKQMEVALSMDSATSEMTVKSLVPPKAPKAPQSQYVSFKSIMLKDAKAKGDKEKVKDMTNIAKAAWNKVKDVDASDSTSSPAESTATGTDLDRFLAFKHQVIKDEADEHAKYDANIEKFRASFCNAAISFLYWKTEGATDSNIKAFGEALKMVHSKAMIAWGNDLPDGYIQSHSNAKAKLEAIQKRVAVDDLAYNLKIANDDKLRDHAIAHYEALKKLECMEEMEEQIASFQQAKVADQFKEIISATSLKNEICQALHKQMVYTNKNLKHSSKAISFKRNGVTKFMFAKAFDVAEGTVKVTFSGWDVGSKSLRYSSLYCQDVTVKLLGETLTASTKYSF